MKRDPATAHAEGRLTDRALVLTVSTLILLTPPLLEVVDRPVLLLGIPILHIYCYCVWLAAIGCGARLAIRLNSSHDNPVGDAESIERD